MRTFWRNIMPKKVHITNGPFSWIVTTKKEPVERDFPIDDEIDRIRKRFNDLTAARPKRPKSVKKLAEKILALGGSKIAFLYSELDWLDGMYDYGELIKYKVTVKRMEMHECHKNCLKVWKKNPAGYSVVTGYNLNGQIWNSHTWLIDIKKKIIIDPLSKAKIYYGVIMNENETKRWYDEQFPKKKAVKKSK